MRRTQRLGILTSGGDCPGLNAVIRAVVRHATLTYGWDVVGIPYATQGLQDRKTISLNVHGLDLHGIDPLLSLGGTILGTINKGDTLEHTDEILAGYRELDLDALVLVGGDGSLAILNHLASLGDWNIVAIPKTIDGDVALTERAIGFNSAVNTIVESLNRLTYTAASHDRVMVVEVMGRQAGHLALHSGLAGGADAILIPEIPYSIEALCQHLRTLRDRWGRRFAIVVVAEGAKTVLGEEKTYTDALGEVRLGGIGQCLAEDIPLKSGNQLECRATVLGHVQRGGLPTALDSITAAAFGKAAVDAIAAEKYGSMVAWQQDDIVLVPLSKVLALSPHAVEPESCLVKTARALGIYCGDL